MILTVRFPQFSAQAFYQIVCGPGICLPVILPEIFQQFISAYCPVLMFHKIGKKIKFRRS